MIRPALRLFGILTALVVPQVAQADDQTKKPAPLVIGTMQEVPPYVFEHPSRGIDIDIIRAAFARMGREVVIMHVPTLRLERLLSSGRAHAISVNSADVKGCIPSQPFSYWRDAVLVRKGLPKGVYSMIDLAGLNVATFPKAERALGNALKPFIRYFGSYNYLINTDALDLLQRGRLDAYIGDRLLVEYSLNERGWEGELPYELAFDLPPTPRLLCFSDKAMAARFDAALAEIQAAGADQQINNVYLGRLRGEDDTPADEAGEDPAPEAPAAP
ncbi:substrate-binding periplasmic protein [Gimibacter soli]|uniref:Transporter substrate-binding domain-containing protein n=1 Tax=Gimibacter soli TaxID=3024400 RepID=A0AAE9XUB6_9PROT|nr:transporter substrate-binding domain-containing protein [Gimibacter soli]WCL55480.1 transporter substrate-binding domain-containing protein [Gimibacter soli]